MDEFQYMMVSDGGWNPIRVVGCWAFVIVKDEKVIYSDTCATLGMTTNNVQEYTGMVSGMQRALDMGIRRLLVVSDSQLAVRHMRGIYRVSSVRLLPFYERAKYLEKCFDEVMFEWRTRDDKYITKCDELGRISVEIEFKKHALAGIFKD